MDNIGFLVYSILLRGKETDEDITVEDIKNAFDEDFNDCSIELYKNVISWLSENKSYEEIYDLIDKYDDIDFDNLLIDQKIYIKKRIKNDLKIRKLKER